MGVQNPNEKYLENKQKKFVSDEGKYWPQVLAIFIISLGSFTNGLMFAWSSPFALVITQDKENYNLTEEDASYFIVFQPLGMILASLFFFKISEYLGRKKSVLCLSIPHLLSWIITIFAKSRWEFYAARFVAGFGDAVLFCSIPPYVGEITTPIVRGYWGNFPTFVLNFGSVVITILGSYVDVKMAAYLCIGVPLIFVALVGVILPESPYHLIRESKYEEAKRSIKWLRRKANVEEDFLNMKKDVERQMSESGTWKDLFTIASNRRALRAGLFLRASQQFCGIAVFGSYSQTIFQKAGGDVSPQNASIIFIGLVCALNLICSLSIEKFGRKPSYFWSVLICGLILVIMSVYFFLDQYDIVNLESISWFPLAGMIAFVVAFSPGLGIIPTLMLGELFSASIKSKGLSVLIAAFGLAVFVTSNLFHILSANVGLYSPFLVYGLSCLLSTILTLRWVPETKGKTLEEIQQELKI